VFNIIDLSIWEKIIPKLGRKGFEKLNTSVEKIGGSSVGMGFERI
jgi:hypothetical protein